LQQVLRHERRVDAGAERAHPADDMARSHLDPGTDHGQVGRRGERHDRLVSLRRASLPISTDLTDVGKTQPRLGHSPGMTTHHVVPLGRCGSPGPPVDVETWRWCRLLEAGFPPDLARALSSRTAIDLHALLELVDRGC